MTCGEVLKRGEHEMKHDANNECAELTMSLLSDMVMAEFDELDLTLRKCSYFSRVLNSRVWIVTDIGGELFRIYFINGQLRILVKPTHEIFNSISNDVCKQFEQFLLALYDKYDMPRRKYYRKHNIRKLL